MNGITIPHDIYQYKCSSLMRSTGPTNTESHQIYSCCIHLWFNFEQGLGLHITSNQHGASAMLATMPSCMHEYKLTAVELA